MTNSVCEFFSYIPYREFFSVSEAEQNAIIWHVHFTLFEFVAVEAFCALVLSIKCCGIKIEKLLILKILFFINSICVEWFLALVLQFP